MIVRTLKLRLNNRQEAQLNNWLWHLTGLYNWASRKIELDAKDRRYHTLFDLQKLIVGHSVKMEIPSHTMRAIIDQAHDAWQKCFQKIRRKPNLKGNKNRLRSIPFPDPINSPKGNFLKLEKLGKVRFVKQQLPNAKIKCVRIVKKPTGWFASLWLDCDHIFPVKQNHDAVGIDPGFSHLLTLSTGLKIKNPRELGKCAARLAQAQKGLRKKQIERIIHYQSNQRKDRNHKISRKLVETFKTICYSKDNFAAISKTFGKSIREAGLGQLIRFLNYKCRTGGRELVSVNSRFTTMTCSSCMAQSGPSGLSKLKVRNWECTACGANHDRDINAAKNILNFAPGRGVGSGISLSESVNRGESEQKNELLQTEQIP